MSMHIGSKLRYGVTIVIAMVLGGLPISYSQASAQQSNSDGGDVGYVALGDSVAAGLGLTAADNGSEPACGQSTEAYPALVAEEQGVSYTSYACSGATAGDLVTEQHLSGTGQDIEPQLDGAFANGTPSLITITAGANDIHWPYFIRKCYVSTCGTGADKVAVKALLAALRFKLGYALNSIEDRSDNDAPKVVLTGYYKPFAKACANQQNKVTSAELKWLNSQTDALNKVIANAVRAHSSFAEYAPVSFKGHELCTSDPWIQGLQDSAPFHPTAEGQSKIADAVLDKID